MVINISCDDQHTPLSVLEISSFKKQVLLSIDIWTVTIFLNVAQITFTKEFIIIQLPYRINMK